MANTYTSLHYHTIFSTKNREPWIRRETEQRVWSFLGGIARENDLKPLSIGGIDNHVHLLLGIPPSIAISKAIQQIKGGSSGWMKETFPGLGGFGWQDGYGAFTVSKSLVGEVDRYIATQPEHHRLKTFEEEYRLPGEARGALRGALFVRRGNVGVKSCVATRRGYFGLLRSVG